MAIAGRKQTDMLRSLAAGSAEDFDNECEPCLTIGQHVEAHGYCVQCQEYFCKTCYDCHRRSKLSRSHQILGRDKFDELQTQRKSCKECNEQCPLHQKEVIQFYCPKHAQLGCNDCMAIGHKACEVNYIPKKCVGIVDSKEYHDITTKLSKKLREAEQISKKAESRSSDINDMKKELIKQIAEFRVEINYYLDQIQRDVLNNVEEKTSKLNANGVIQKVIDTCGNTIFDVKKLHSILRANKSDNKNCQLYIDIKRAESALKSYELAEEKETLLNMNIQYSFRRNTDLENLLSKKIVLGELIKLPHIESIKKMKTIDHLSVKDVINVKTKSDKKDCYITGCAVLPSNKLVLVDSNNIKVKVVSVQNKLVLQDKASIL